MPYISKSNASRIIELIDFNAKRTFEGILYTREIELFSKKDKNRLLALSELYSDPQKFLDSKYSKIENVDTLKYVFEGGQSAYHAIKECPKLNTTFYNFKKDFLKKYHEEFKVPLTKLLREYYRIKSNPLLSFEGNILEQLGFRPCSACHQEY